MKSEAKPRSLLTDNKRTFLHSYKIMPRKSFSSGASLSFYDQIGLMYKVQVQTEAVYKLFHLALTCLTDLPSVLSSNKFGFARVNESYVKLCENYHLAGNLSFFFYLEARETSVPPKPSHNITV